MRLCYRNRRHTQGVPIEPTHNVTCESRHRRADPTKRPGRTSEEFPPACLRVSANSVLLVAFDGDHALEWYPTGSVESCHSRLPPRSPVAWRCVEVDAVNKQRSVKAFQIGRL